MDRDGDLRDRLLTEARIIRKAADMVARYGYGVVSILNRYARALEAQAAELAPGEPDA